MTAKSDELVEELVSACVAFGREKEPDWQTRIETARAAFPVVIAKTGFDYAHGTYVIVVGDNGNSARYYHLTEQDLAELEPRIGEHVDLGARLGIVGATGNTSGNHYGLEIGYIDEHNPRNTYFSTVPEQRWYYNDIINKLIAGTFDEYRSLDGIESDIILEMESIK